jgi:hypothetical protein
LARSILAGYFDARYTRAVAAASNMATTKCTDNQLRKSLRDVLTEPMKLDWGHHSHELTVAPHTPVPELAAFNVPLAAKLRMSRK